ncbi:MAG: hypothetical protein Tsb0010_18670 [Parvularculaceae bacterium]
MHRSGTSCLAGCLEEAGLYLGDVNTKAQFNAKGNRENFAAMAVHDDVLASADGQWDNPPELQPRWDETAIRKLESVIASYPIDKIWGLKDPRLLFVMDGWRKLTDPKLVGTFRHPAEVAKSLLRRAESWNRPMDEAHAFDLWARYNRRMLEERARTAFPIIRYPDRDYISKVTGICKNFGLAPPPTFTFFDSELRHYDAVSAEVPGELREIWAELNDVAI